MGAIFLKKNSRMAYKDILHFRYFYDTSIKKVSQKKKKGATAAAAAKDLYVCLMPLLILDMKITLF